MAQTNIVIYFIHIALYNSQSANLETVLVDLHRQFYKARRLNVFIIFVIIITIIVAILQMRKLRLSEVKSIHQDHTAERQ
jgi:hypothetical protein